MCIRDSSFGETELRGDSRRCYKCRRFGKCIQTLYGSIGSVSYTHLDVYKRQQQRSGKSDADAIAYADKNIDKYAPVPWCGYTDWGDYLFKKGSHSSRCV